VDLDDDFASRVACPDVPDCLRDLAQHVLPIDDRADLPSFGELFQQREASGIVLRDEWYEPLAHERGQRGRLEEACGRREPPPGRGAHGNQSPLLGQDAAAIYEGPISADVEEHVVAHLYLEKWNGWWWAIAAWAETSSSEESISYSGGAGYYRWAVQSYSGSGSYTFWLQKP
jgi:hypothetical protein